MTEELNITVSTAPVSVQITLGAPPASVAVTTGSGSTVTVAQTVTATQVNATIEQPQVIVEIPASGGGGAGPPGPPGANGISGTSFTPVVLTLAAYLALTAPQQLDPTKWYVIPKT